MCVYKFERKIKGMFSICLSVTLFLWSCWLFSRLEQKVITWLGLAFFNSRRCDKDCIFALVKLVDSKKSGQQQQKNSMLELLYQAGLTSTIFLTASASFELCESQWARKWRMSQLIYRGLCLQYSILVHSIRHCKGYSSS